MPRSARSAALFVRQIAAVAEEAGEGVPALQHVVHRLGRRRRGATACRGSRASRSRARRPAARCAAGARRGARSAGRPLMARSAAKIASIRRTASMASGARATSASSNSLRRPCAQQAASVIGPGLATRLVEVVEPGIGVGLQDAGIAGQVPARVLGGAVARVAEHRRRRRRAGEGPVVAHIGPEPAGDGLAPGQHRHGGVVAMQALGGEDMGVDQRHQRRQGGGAGADPVGDASRRSSSMPSRA